VSDEKRRPRIAEHVVDGGLVDSDLRVLGDAAGLFVGRWTSIDDNDPLRPISDRILTMLKLGRLDGGEVILALCRSSGRWSVGEPRGG
jgi:hypothetical protein